MTNPPLDTVGMTTRDISILKYVNQMNSTTHMTACVLVLATFYVVVALVADLAGHVLDEHTMNHVATFIEILAGAGLGQFVAKRYSDRELAAAKAGAGPQVIVPSNTTTVQPGTEPVQVIPATEAKP